MLTRREFGKLALAGVPAAAILHGREPFLSAFAQAKPNSLIDGVQIGTITYSYRSMPDQSAEATLKYIVDSGISAIELMGGPVNDWARKKGNFQPSNAGGGRAAGGGGGAGGGRAGGGGGGRGRAEVDPATLTAEWNGVKCAPGREGGAARAVAAACRPPATQAQPRRQRAQRLRVEAAEDAAAVNRRPSRLPRRPKNASGGWLCR